MGTRTTADIIEELNQLRTSALFRIARNSMLMVDAQTDLDRFTPVIELASTHGYTASKSTTDTVSRLQAIIAEAESIHTSDIVSLDRYDTLLAELQPAG